MAKTRPPYTPEFRRQMVELVRAGRSPEELMLGSPVLLKTCTQRLPMMKVVVCVFGWARPSFVA
jgi:hypothetical protein